jgi:erythromycin esterase
MSNVGIAGAALAVITGLAVLAVGCARAPLSADTGRDALVAWASRESAPVTSVALGRLAGRARVLALGEAAHGVDVTLASRNEIVRHLVDDHGVTGVALETGYAESLCLAAFADGGPGEAREVAQRCFTSGFGNFAANAALLEWTRRHNAAAPRGKRVRLFGIDLSLGGPLASWASPAPIECALRAIASRRTAEAARLDAMFRAGLAQMLTRQTPLTSDEQDRYATFARDLAAAAGQSGSAVAMRCAAVAEQAGEVSRVTPAPSAGGIAPGAWRSLEARDLAMADNVLWALDQLGPGGRLLVFAHNAHVINEPQRGAHLRRLAQAPRSMGQRLRETLAADLVIVAEAAPGGGGPDFGDVLRTATSGARLIDLRSAPAAARGWLLHPQRLRANVDGSTTVTPATAFDALVIR